MIRLATVGTSGITDKFLSAVKLSGRFCHTAVYSRNEETGKKFAEKHGVKAVFTDLEEMAKSDIDAVYIATPNRFHAAQSKIFLLNGKHVICEKPITVSEAEYNEVKRIADERGLIYMEAIIPPNSEQNRKVHRALEQIGDIKAARIDFCQRSSRLDDFYAGKPQNIFDMSLCAGAFMDLGVYCIYGAVDLLGMPKKIYARSDFFETGCDSGGRVIFEYDGFSALISYGKAGQSIIGSEIIGDKGTLAISHISKYSSVKLLKDEKIRTIVKDCEHVACMLGEVNNFADFTENKNLPEYERLSGIAKNVQKCMDAVKKKAGLFYPE